MSATSPIRQYASFEPRIIEAMTRALEDVCIALKITDTHSREIMATRIIDLARLGIADEHMLRERVLREAEMSAALGDVNAA